MSKPLSEGIFRKWVCPTCRPAIYRRKEGPCPTCGQQLAKGPLCITWKQRGKWKTETPKRQAMKYLKALLAKREAQAREGFVLASTMPWGKLADEWLKLEASKHADGGERSRQAIDRLKKTFEKIPLAELLRKDLLAYCTERGGEVSDSTVAKEVRLFKQIWKYAMASDYVSTNPWENIRVKAGLPPIKAPLSPEDIERLFNELPKTSRPIYRFLLLTGCRGKEARLLLKADVDLKRQIVWVVGKTREGQKDRQAVHLSQQAAELVKQAMDSPTEWLFPNLRTEKPYFTLRPMFYRAVRKAKMQGKIAGCHDLRHLFVSRLIMSGSDLITASTLSRHKSLQMLKRYTHLTTDHLQDALAKAENLSNSHQTTENEDKG